MEDLMNLPGGQNTALVILDFLQADCRNADYDKELHSLGRDLNITREVPCSDPRIQDVDDGDLETDGHLPSCIAVSLDDIRPAVELLWPRNHEGAVIQQVAEELREIAAQLELSVVAQATQNLSRNITTTPLEQWKNHLTWEVQRVMRQGVGLAHLPQERVMVALTLTLVKGVCEHAPRLLRNLFCVALHYICSLTLG